MIFLLLFDVLSFSPGKERPWGCKGFANRGRRIYVFSPSTPSRGLLIIMCMHVKLASFLAKNGSKSYLREMNDVGGFRESDEWDEW